MASEEDSSGYIIIDLHTIKYGVGTRESGERLRNELVRVFNQSGMNFIIDFANMILWGN